MARASWCIATPTQGSGNGTIDVGASVHSGRAQRLTSVTVKATGVTDSSVNVTQMAKEEFVTLNNISAGKEGGNITVTGKTNTSKLTFSLGQGDIAVVIPEKYSAGGAETQNGVVIIGDPGKSEEFDFSIQLNIPENTTTEGKAVVLIATASGGQSASATISQLAGNAMLSVTPTEITLDANGTMQTVTVTSNTNWQVE